MRLLPLQMLAMVVRTKDTSLMLEILKAKVCSFEATENPTSEKPDALVLMMLTEGLLEKVKASPHENNLKFKKAKLTKKRRIIEVADDGDE